MSGLRIAIFVGLAPVVVIGVIGTLTGAEPVLAPLQLVYPFAVVLFVVAAIKSCRRPASLSRAAHIQEATVNWALWLALVALLLFFTLPLINTSREAPRRCACCNNLRRIGIAMEIYSVRHGCYPPAYLVDHDGRPTISWRVLLLPYLDDPDATGVYKKIRLDEPWDGPHNRAVTSNKTVEQLFHCPTATSPRGETNYAMVVGPDTISDGPHATRPEDIKGRPSCFIVVVEVVGIGIQWAEPRDLDLRTMSFRLNDATAEAIRSEHQSGANVLFADGGVRFVSAALDPKVIKAGLTRNGGKDASKLDN